MPSRRASSRVWPSKPTSAKKRTAPATIMLSRSAGLRRWRVGAAALAARLRVFPRAAMPRRALMRGVSLPRLAGVGLEARGLDAGNAAGFVVVRRVARDTHSADYVA